MRDSLTNYRGNAKILKRFFKTKDNEFEKFLSALISVIEHKKWFFEEHGTYFTLYNHEGMIFCYIMKRNLNVVIRDKDIEGERETGGYPTFNLKSEEKGMWIGNIILENFDLEDGVMEVKGADNPYRRIKGEKVEDIQHVQKKYVASFKRFGKEKTNSSIYLYDNKMPAQGKTYDSNNDSTIKTFERLALCNAQAADAIEKLFVMYPNVMNCIVDGQKIKNVLDIGCSYGDLRKYLSRNGMKIDYVGLDARAHKMLKYWVDDCGMTESTFIGYDLSLPWLFKKCQFDAIVFVATIEHLEMKHQAVVLKNIRKSLVDDGSLFLQTNCTDKEGNYGWPGEHISERPYQEFVDMFAECGLSIEREVVLGTWGNTSRMTKEYPEMFERAKAMTDTRLRKLFAGLFFEGKDARSIFWVLKKA